MSPGAASSLTVPALPSPKRDMQAGNDETDCPQSSCGDTVGIQSKDDQILAPAVRVRESMAPLDVVSQR